MIPLPFRMMCSVFARVYGQIISVACLVCVRAVHLNCAPFIWCVPQKILDTTSFHRHASLTLYLIFFSVVFIIKTIQRIKITLVFSHDSYAVL